MHHPKIRNRPKAALLPRTRWHAGPVGRLQSFFFFCHHSQNPQLMFNLLRRYQGCTAPRAPAGRAQAGLQPAAWPRAARGSPVLGSAGPTVPGALPLKPCPLPWQLRTALRLRVISDGLSRPRRRRVRGRIMTQPAPRGCRVRRRGWGLRHSDPGATPLRPADQRRRAEVAQGPSSSSRHEGCHTDGISLLGFQNMQ